MSRFEVPLQHRTLRTTGDTVIWADLVRCWRPESPAPAQTRNLLGLTGVINQIRLSFEGTPSVPAPWGVIVLEQR